MACPIKYNEKELAELKAYLREIAMGYRSPSEFRKNEPAKYALIQYHGFKDILREMPRERAPAHQDNNNKWSAK